MSLYIHSRDAFSTERKKKETHHFSDVAVTELHCVVPDDEDQQSVVTTCVLITISATIGMNPHAAVLGDVKQLAEEDMVIIMF